MQLAMPVQLLLPVSNSLWIQTRDGDLSALDLFSRHYSFRRYADNRPRRLFVGPGEKMVLITPDARALFVWRKFQSDNGQSGVNCAVFRNEGPVRSSELIRAACRLAWSRWPGERLYTYVNQRKVKSTNPGYCFLKAGWRKCGFTKHNKLLILEILPGMGGFEKTDLGTGSSPGQLSFALECAGMCGV